MKDKVLKSADAERLLTTLKERFIKNSHRHPNTEWSFVESILLNNPNKLWSVFEMENTEGEPDVILLNNELYYCDCSLESPKGRRSLCYDKEAWDSRKENKPTGNAIDMANRMGLELLDEGQYLQLQNIENFDLKTSSWLKTTESIRSKKGAIFGDKRYGRAFIYHNGAESYYAARGFRGIIKL